MDLVVLGLDSRFSDRLQEQYRYIKSELSACEKKLNILDHPPLIPPWDAFVVTSSGRPAPRLGILTKGTGNIKSTPEATEVISSDWGTSPP